MRRGRDAAAQPGRRRPRPITRVTQLAAAAESSRSSTSTADPDEVGAEEDDVAVDEPSTSPGWHGPASVSASRWPRDRAVPGGGRGAAHRDAGCACTGRPGSKTASAATPCTTAARAHDVDLDARVGGGLGGGLGGQQGVAVARQDDDRQGVHGADLVQELPRGRPPARPAADHAGAGRAKSVGRGPRPAAQATTATGVTGSDAGADPAVDRWVTRIRCGRPASTPASRAAPTSSTWTCTFQRSGPPTTSSESRARRAPGAASPPARGRCRRAGTSPRTTGRRPHRRRPPGTAVDGDHRGRPSSPRSPGPPRRSRGPPWRRRRLRPVALPRPEMTCTRDSRTRT